MYLELEIYLHIPPPRDADRLPVHVREERTRNGQDRPRRLLGIGRPPQRNIRIRLPLLAVPATGSARELPRRDAQRDLGAVGHCEERAVLLRGRQARRHMAEGDGVGADAELRAPFFGDGLGQADEAGFGEGVVGLASTYR